MSTHTPHPVVWIAGSSRGIGRALAVAFGQQGWRIAIHGRTDSDALHQTKSLVEHTGADTMTVTGDVRDGDAMRNGVAAITQTWGRLNAAVVNAGIAASALTIKTTMDQWQETLATNLTGCFHTLRAAGEAMTTQGGGHVVVVGSFAGAQGQQGQAAYAASKAGLIGLVRSAAREWGAANVRVNLVLPGWHATDLAGEDFPGHGLGDHLLGRTADLQEVARSIVHLASCRDVSGQVWNLDSRPLP
ncbi:MAG: SDR family oxidoreductase [Nitrospiraceae bacterium]